MAKVVDFAGRQVVRDLGARERLLFEALEAAGVKNARKELRSLVILGFDYRGTPCTWKVWEDGDALSLIGALEVLKAELMRRIMETRGHTDKLTED